jgi:hypothetical protein
MNGAYKVFIPRTELDVDLISEGGAASPLLLSIGYGNGHIVIQLEGMQAFKNILAFIDESSSNSGAHWIEAGRFASNPVTLTLSKDIIALVVDSNVSVGSFGQSFGLYIPADLLDAFVTALAAAQARTGSLP